MVEVFFATNRRANRKKDPTDFGKDFSEDGLASLRFGLAKVTGSNLDRYSLTVAPEKIVLDRRRMLTDKANSIFGSQLTFRQVRKKMLKHGRDTVVFVHGYNVTFGQALSAAARLKRNFGGLANGGGVNVVLFSWPSDGSMMPFLAYANDRQDAAASGPAFARGFLKVAKFLRGVTPEEECRQSVHLLAHSMGNYVVRHAVQEIERHSSGRPSRVFDQIFLMAADEDDDAFEHRHKLLPLPRLAKRVNVYFNNEDLAMDISDKTKGHPDRLGADGPRLPRSVPGKVTLIDCTPVVAGVFEHSYFLESDIVVRDMRDVLSGILPEHIKGRSYVAESNRYRLVKPKKGRTAARSSRSTAAPRRSR